MLAVNKKFFLNVGTVLAIAGVLMSGLIIIVGTFHYGGNILRGFTPISMALEGYMEEVFPAILMLVYGILIAVYYSFVRVWAKHSRISQHWFSSKYNEKIRGFEDRMVFIGVKAHMAIPQFFFWLFAWLLTPFIALLAVPRLKKKGLEAALDKQLAKRASVK